MYPPPNPRKNTQMVRPFPTCIILVLSFSEKKEPYFKCPPWHPNFRSTAKLGCNFVGNIVEEYGRRRLVYLPAARSTSHGWRPLAMPCTWRDCFLWSSQTRPAQSNLPLPLAGPLGVRLPLARTHSDRWILKSLRRRRLECLCPGRWHQHPEGVNREGVVESGGRGLMPTVLMHVLRDPHRSRSWIPPSIGRWTWMHFKCGYVFKQSPTRDWISTIKSSWKNLNLLQSTYTSPVLRI